MYPLAIDQLVPFSGWTFVSIKDMTLKNILFSQPFKFPIDHVVTFYYLYKKGILNVKEFTSFNYQIVGYFLRRKPNEQTILRWRPFPIVLYVSV